MPVRKMTARELLGGKPLVLSGQPFHKGLKRPVDSLTELHPFGPKARSDPRDDETSSQDPKAQ